MRCPYSKFSDPQTEQSPRDMRTGRVSAGKALAALIHHVLISGARQVRTGLPIREATVEEVWAWPGRYEHGLNSGCLQLQKLFFGVSDINNPVNCWSSRVSGKIMRLD